MAAACDVEAHPEREARLSDGRPGREHDEVADREPFRVVVDLPESRRDPAHLERTLHAVGEVLVVGLKRGGDVAELRICRLVAKREESLLGAVEREGDVGRFVVRIRRDRRGRTEQAPQDRPVADDVAVAVDLGRCRNAIRECAEVGLAARSVELFPPGELHLDGERIDPLTPLEKGLGRVIYPLMPSDVKVVDAEQVSDLEDGVAVDKEASEYLLLRALVERDLPVGRARLEGHAGNS